MNHEDSSERGLVEYANWPGVLTGLIMLALPFLGPWWRMSFGEIFEISLSPFHYEASLMGQVFSVPLLNYVIPALQTLLFIGGICLVVGSLFWRKEWSERLSKFGFRKIFWPFVFFVFVLLLGAFFTNNFLTGSIPGVSSEALQSMQDNIKTEVPYLSGTGTAEVEARDITASIPITFSLTPVFWVVLAAVALGTFSRRFYSDMVEKESFKQEKLKR